jgi:hypothetical protein
MYVPDGCWVAAHGLVFAVVDLWSSWSRLSPHHARRVAAAASSAFSPSRLHCTAAWRKICEVANRRSLASRDSKRPCEATYSTRSILRRRLHECVLVGPRAGWSAAHRDHPVPPPLAAGDDKRGRESGERRELQACPMDAACAGEPRARACARRATPGRWPP